MVKRALTVMAMVACTAGVAQAQEAMAKIDKTLVEEPLIFPTSDFLDNAFSFKATDDKQSEKYDRDFQTAISA